MSRPLLSIVSTVKDEAPVLPAFLERLDQALAEAGVDGEIVLVDDGSTDDTPTILDAALKNDPRLVVVELSRNFGKEAAMTAGLEHAAGDAVVVIDADLQDPPELIPRMVEFWRNGAEVVLAKRRDRSSDAALKRLTAKSFYRVFNALSNPGIPADVGDFRLMDRAVVDALKRLPETQRFMKGVFAWVGFKTAFLDYDRPPRAAGESKFSGWKLWNFALEGVTSFSTIPLRVWTYLGLGVACFSFLYGLYVIIKTLVLGVDLPGYASTMTVVLFLGGLNLMGIGVVGEYIGRIYLEAKRRPIYLTRRVRRGEATKPS